MPRLLRKHPDLRAGDEVEGYLDFVFGFEHAQNADRADAKIVHQYGGAGVTGQYTILYLHCGLKSDRLSNFLDGQVAADLQSELIAFSVSIRKTFDLLGGEGSDWIGGGTRGNRCGSCYHAARCRMLIG